MAPDGRALLDRVGLRPGQSAADHGCGPRGVLDLLAERVSPGGRVVGVDLPVVFGRNGADPHIGRRVPELFRQAGLEDVEVEVTARAYPPGHSRRTVYVDLVRSMRPHVLDLGLASEADLDELDAAAGTHLDDPRTVMVPSLLFLVSGRKPGRPGDEFPGWATS